MIATPDVTYWVYSLPTYQQLMFENCMCILHDGNLHLICSDVHILAVDSWMVGEIGHHIIMSCPVQPSYQNLSYPLGMVQWHKGYFTPKLVARAAILKPNVVLNATYGESSQDLSIDASGDLTIWNLKLDDAGLYTCSVTPNPNRVIQLYLTGM